MKALLSLTLYLLSSQFSSSEVIEIHTVKKRFLEQKIFKNETEHKEALADVRTVLQLHKKIGVIDSKNITLNSLVSKAREYDSSEDPFFGFGSDYILKDASGNYYILFFEYNTKPSGDLEAFRFAVNYAVRLEVADQEVFIGSPYVGISFDQAIVDQLKVITKAHKK